MFGENFIYGNKILKLDSKGRIFLPSFTLAEVHDSIVIGIDEEKSYVMLFLKSKLDELLNSLIEKQTDIEQYKKIQYFINIIQICCYDFTSVDAQKRILIPKELVKMLDFENNVFVYGGTDFSIPSLRIYKNKEEANISLNKQKKLLYPNC